MSAHIVTNASVTVRAAVKIKIPLWCFWYVGLCICECACFCSVSVYERVRSLTLGRTHLLVISVEPLSKTGILEHSKHSAAPGG